MPANLVFFMTDHQRADSLGMVQGGVEVCPNLNRLAAGGALFTRAYNTCPLCVPARTALATGQYPTRNGVVTNDWEGETAGDHVTIHELLHREGYTVGHVGVDHIRVRPPLRERFPFAAWVSEAEYRAYRSEAGIEGAAPPDSGSYTTEIMETVAGVSSACPYSSVGTGRWPYDADTFKDLYYCRHAVDFIRAAAEPFALFVYLWAPHPPLWVPEPYASRFDPRAIQMPPNVGVSAHGEPANRRRGVAGQLGDEVSADQWSRVWAAHLGLVNMADTGLGRVLSALEEAGHAETTAVVCTADHGDHLGQHGMYQKMEMYEQAIRVPLVVSGPGVARGTFRTPVSHLDVMPTLAEWLSGSVPGGLDGVSLVPCLTGDAPPPERDVFSQYSGNRGVGDIRRTIIADRLKYTFDPCAEPEFYDLENDALEMNNLAQDPERRANMIDLHARLAAWHEARGDWLSY